MSATPSAPEACPPPLLWQDVRREYLAQSSAHIVESSVGPVAVRTWGTGPALYLLPGFTSPAELYCLMIWLLKDEFRCVTLEPGESTKRVSSSTGVPIGREVEMLRAATADHGDAEFSVCGANYGAAWALAAAVADPKRVQRLVLINGFAQRRISWWERLLMNVCNFTKQRLSSFPWRETFQIENHRRWFPPFDPTRFQYFLDASGNMPLRELAARANAVRQCDLRPRLNPLEIPTLLVRTEGEGRIAAAAQVELEQMLPQVRTEWLHNTGQLPYLTHPHRLAKLIRTFHAEHQAEPTVALAK